MCAAATDIPRHREHSDAPMTARHGLWARSRLPNLCRKSIDPPASRQHDIAQWQTAFAGERLLSSLPAPEHTEWDIMAGRKKRMTMAQAALLAFLREHREPGSYLPPSGVASATPTERDTACRMVHRNLSWEGEALHPTTVSSFPGSHVLLGYAPPDRVWPCIL